MKKLAILLAVIMVFALMVGCSNDTGETPSSAPSSDAGDGGDATKAPEGADPLEGVTEIIGQMQSGPEYEFMAEVAAAWSEETGVTCTVNSLGRDGWQQKISTALFAQSSEFDWFACGTAETIAWMAGNTLADVTPLVEANDKISLDQFTDGGISAVTFAGDGKVYGLPMITSAIMLFYRTDLIDTPPETWEEYYEMAEQFTQSVNPDSPTQYGTAFLAKISDATALGLSPYFWAQGIDYIDGEDKIYTNTPEGIKAIEYYSSRVLNGLVPPDWNTYDYGGIETAFGQGIVAMAEQWDAAAGTYANPESCPLVCENFTAAVAPGIEQEDGSVKKVPYLNFWMTGINAASTRQAATMEFFSYMYNPEVFESHLSGHPGVTTALKDVIPTDTFKALKEATYTDVAFSESLNVGRGYTTHACASDIKVIVNEEMDKIFMGDQTAAEGAAVMETRIQEAVDRYNEENS